MSNYRSVRMARGSHGESAHRVDTAVRRVGVDYVDGSSYVATVVVAQDEGGTVAIEEQPIYGTPGFVGIAPQDTNTDAIVAKVDGHLSDAAAVVSQRDHSAVDIMRQEGFAAGVTLMYNATVKLALRVDGTAHVAEIGSDGNALATYADVVSLRNAIDELRGDFNAFVSMYNSHVHPANGAVTAQQASSTTAAASVSGTHVLMAT